MMLAPSVTQDMLYCHSQDLQIRHEVAEEQHNSVRSMPSERIDAGVTPRSANPSNGATTPSRTMVFVQATICDAEQGDPLIKLSVPVMHTVP